LELGMELAQHPRVALRVERDGQWKAAIDDFL
jgi:hypothetical protein